MKKISMFLVMSLTAGVAMSQTNVNLLQTGNTAYWMTSLINNAGIQQNGTNIDATLSQIGGTWNNVTVGQDGTNLSLKLDANAGAQNDAGFLQSGDNGTIDINQVATTLDNYIQTWQQSGLGYIANNNFIKVDQDAGTSNYLFQRQSGKNDIVNLKQTANTFNKATTAQGQWGALETDNKLFGATIGTWGPLYDELNPAVQTSTNSSNTLVLDQDGNFNKVGLHQDGLELNNAAITQSGGNNSLLVYQTNSNGSNSVISNQVGGFNSASVLQTTVSGNGTIVVNQN